MPEICSATLFAPVFLFLHTVSALIEILSACRSRVAVLSTIACSSQWLFLLPVYVLHVLDFRNVVTGRYVGQLQIVRVLCVFIFAVQTLLLLSGIILLFLKRRLSRHAAALSTYAPINAETEDDEARSIMRSIASGRSNDDSRLGKAEDGLGRGVLSLFLFLWVNPLIKLGSTTPLESYEQLFELPDDLRSGHETEVLANYLHMPSNRTSRIYLLRALWRTYGWSWLALGLVKLLFALLNYIPPLMLSGMVSYLEVVNGHDADRKRDLDYYSGFYYAAGIVATSFVVGFLSVHYRFRISRLSLSLRGAIMDMVYAKLMRIRSCDLSVEMESSQVMNLVGTDCERIADSIMYIHQLWALPFQVGIALYLLYLQVGLAFLGGVAFAVLLLPVNQYLASRITHLFDKQMKSKDGRVKLLSECLASMRVIKLHAWEPYFEARMNDIRKGEMRSWSGIKYLDAFCVYFWATTPVLMAVITFTVFVLTGNTLTAARTFTTIAIFHLLLIPLNVIPWILTGATETWVSIKRLQTYFSLDDVDYADYYTTDLPVSSNSITARISSPVPNIATKLNVLKVDNMSFQWIHPDHKEDENEKPDPVTERNGSSSRGPPITDGSTTTSREIPGATTNALAIVPSSDVISPPWRSPSSTGSSPSAADHAISCSPYANSHMERSRLQAGLEVPSSPSHLDVANSEQRHTENADESNISAVCKPDGGNADAIVTHADSLNTQMATAKLLLATPNDKLKPTLKRLTLDLFEGELVGVVGRVGSGKSSLLMALVAEMHQHRAPLDSAYAQEQHSFRINPRLLRAGFGVALQDSWIQQGTVRENILFCTKAGVKSQAAAPVLTMQQQFDNTDENRHRYNDIIDACALRYDVVRALPRGDATEIGEHGVTLSGGQRARIALARACYADKPVILLDDPLSAVDADVAEHIFTKCVRGVLKGKTVVLVTHHVDFLRAADRVVLMRHGRIAKCGPPAEVLNLIGGDDLRPAVQTKQQEPGADAKPLKSAADGGPLLRRKSEDEMPMAKKSSALAVQQKEKVGKYAEKTSDANVDGTAAQQNGGSEAVALVDDEEREYGVVRAGVWKEYCHAAGWLSSFLVIFTILLQEISYVSTDFWLAHWTSVSERDNTTTLNQSSYTSSESLTTIPTMTLKIIDPRDNWYYLRIYITIAAVNSVCSVFRAFIFAYAGLKAARYMHDKLLKTLLYATQHFYDSTPSGRIINRYGSDIGTIDDSLPFLMNILLAEIFELSGTFAIICIGLPWFTLIILPAVPLYAWIQNLYRKSSREVKRIFTLTRSPIYSWFTESIKGLPHIRAMRMTDRFHAQFRAMLAANQRAKYAEMAANEWLNLRLQMFGAVLVSLVVVIALVVRADAAIVGLTLSYALAVVSLLSALVTSFVGTEQYMVSVERVMQYVTGVVPEKSDGILRPPDDWPERGEISFENVKLRYRADLPFALNGVTVQIKPTEKLAFVGRTGAGKSSMLQALFRTVELAEGRIVIDKFDISHLSLVDLRSRLAIIPQNPVLFDSSLRGNIDPLERHNNDDIVHAIKRCLLQDVVHKLGGWPAVDTVKLGEGGSRLSMGERQLVCLARALVSKSRILCLDEATASVDLDTDRRIQRVLRRAFKNSTVICIAHRIQTVRDYDRVAVMKDGCIVECDAPQVLLSRPESLFYKLANATHDLAGGSRTRQQDTGASDVNAADMLTPLESADENEAL